MSKRKQTSSSVPVEPDWQSLLLICKDCRRRKDGPTHLKAKALASAAKSSMKAAAPRARILLTTCLRLCPRDATAVAFIASNSSPRIVAIESSECLKDLLPQLIAP